MSSAMRMVASNPVYANLCLRGSKTLRAARSSLAAPAIEYYAQGKHRFCRSWLRAGVARFLARSQPTGPTIHVRARILGDDESTYADRAIARKHRILHGFLVPLVHRLRRNKTVHIELTLIDD